MPNISHKEHKPNNNVSNNTQTHSFFKTKVLVILDEFLKVRLIIINNIFFIVSGIWKYKKNSFVVNVLSYSGVTVGFLASHPHLLLSSRPLSSLLFSFVFCDFIYLVKVMIDVSLRVLLLLFFNQFGLKPLGWFVYYFFFLNLFH